MGWLNRRSTLIKSQKSKEHLGLITFFGWFCKMFFPRFDSQDGIEFHIRSIYQSKILISYFYMKKYFDKIIKFSLVNRQIKFYVLKFGMCLHILNLKSLNLLFLFTIEILIILWTCCFSWEGQSFRYWSYLFLFIETWEK